MVLASWEASRGKATPEPPSDRNRGAYSIDVAAAFSSSAAYNLLNFAIRLGRVFPGHWSRQNTVVRKGSEEALVGLSDDGQEVPPQTELATAEPTT